MLLVLILAVHCGADQDSAALSDTQSNAAADSQAETTDPIQHIRSLYAQAMQTPARTTRLECPPDPKEGNFKVRKVDEHLQWYEYTMGYEHGSQSYQILRHQQQIVFIMKTETRWHFDGEGPDAQGKEHTVDIETQERYYYKDSRLIKALYKKAEAHSHKGESLSQKLQQIPNQSHKDPDSTGALQAVRRILQSYNDGLIDREWCGLE